MGYARFLIGFLAGCGVMVLVNSQIQPANAPVAVNVRGTGAVPGPVVPSRVLTAEDAAEITRKQTAQVNQLPQQPVAQGAELPPPPPEERLQAELVQYGLPEPKARAMLAQYGPVKVNALIEREKQRLATGEGLSPNAGSPKSLDASMSAAGRPAGGQAGAAAPASSANEGGSSSYAAVGPPAEEASTAPIAQSNPYQDLKDAYAAHPPAHTAEEIKQNREARFANYVDAVHQAQNEVLQKSNGGEGCSEANCFAPSSAR